MVTKAKLVDVNLSAGLVSQVNRFPALLHPSGSLIDFPSRSRWSLILTKS